MLFFKIMKNKNHEEDLNDLFVDFIDNLAELGKVSRNEQSHSEFTRDNQPVVIEAMTEYESS